MNWPLFLGIVSFLVVVAAALARPNAITVVCLAVSAFALGVNAAAFYLR